MKADAVRIRQAEPRDRDAWIAMWDGFVRAKPGEPGERGLGEVNWARISDEACPLACIVAAGEREDLHGFTLYSPIVWTWSSKPVCYLLDIFVREESRGRGYARKLMQHLAEIGRRDDWFKIFWMTEADNLPAQKLYRSLATQMDYVRFDWNLADRR